MKRAADPAKTVNHPLSRCLRCELANITWSRGEVPYAVRNAIQAIDRNFEIIYDRATAKDPGAPAHHLYRVVARGGGPGMDTLALEFSLQYDIDKVWPTGKPREPGMWIIPEIKARLKSNLDGNPGQIEEKLNEQYARQNAERQDKIEEASAEEHNERMRDLHKYAVKGDLSVVPSIPKRKRGRPRKNAVVLHTVDK